MGFQHISMIFIFFGKEMVYFSIIHIRESRPCYRKVFSCRPWTENGPSPRLWKIQYVFFLYLNPSLKNPELAPEKRHVYLMLFPPLLLGSFLQEMFLRISENSLLNLLDMTEYKIGLRMQLK